MHDVTCERAAMTATPILRWLKIDALASRLGFLLIKEDGVPTLPSQALARFADCRPRFLAIPLFGRAGRAGHTSESRGFAAMAS